MKIVFLSNYYNHHQAYLSRELYRLTDGNYKFIAAMPLVDDKKKLGYPELDDDFVIIYNEKSEEAQSLIDEADVVICGSAPEGWIENRKKQGKLIFRYSERLLKKGFQWWKYPYRFYKLNKLNKRKSQIYLLSASAYAVKDYRKFGLFKDKSFKWGYFPQCKRYENMKELMSAKTENEILWCGRLLDWKHPDDVLEIARKLKAEGKTFHINIIGDGEMRSELESMMDSYGLADCVTFLGSVNATLVREYMEKASVYLFTSDRQEGWGAVLNEAMNSGCAVVASDAAGSTPYLIKDGENGIVYHSGDVEALYNSVVKLLGSPETVSTLGEKAYETITGEWSAENAAKRLIHLCEKILAGEKFPATEKEGPCSPA